MGSIIIIVIYLTIMISRVALIAAVCIATLACASAQSVEFTTTKGKFTIELNHDKAPVSVDNFMAYVNAKFYDGTIFHRVIPNFMAQGGGLLPNLTPKQGERAPIKNEAGNGLKNLRGTVAMARTNDVNSATNQFFVNVADNAFLDHKNNSPSGYGYAVFGKVTSGMDVIDAMVNSPTHTVGSNQNVPETTILIKSAVKVGDSGAASNNADPNNGSVPSKK